MSSQNIDFNSAVVLTPPPSPMSEALLNIMYTWHGLPKELVQDHFEKCKKACSLAYCVYRKQKTSYKESHDAFVSEIETLKEENSVLTTRVRELEEIHSRCNDRLEEVLSNYNSLRNRYRRLLGDSLHQGIPVLRPIQPRELNNDFAAVASQVVSSRKRRRRRSELENLL